MGQFLRLVFSRRVFLFRQEFSFSQSYSFFPSFCQALAEDRVTTPTKKKKDTYLAVKCYKPDLDDIRPCLSSTGNIEEPDASMLHRFANLCVGLGKRINVVCACNTACACCGSTALRLGGFVPPQVTSSPCPLTPFGAVLPTRVACKRRKQAHNCSTNVFYNCCGSLCSVHHILVF